MASAERRSDGDDDAWRAWAEAGSHPVVKWPKLLTALGVAALVVGAVAVQYVLADFGRQGLGDEAELQVVFPGGDHLTGDTRIGVTPLKVRKGALTDLAGWRVTDVQGPVPAGVPNYVDVRLANKGSVPLDANVGLSAYDEHDRELDELVLVRSDDGPAKPFPPCPGPVEHAQLQPGESVTICKVFDVPRGTKLDSLSVGGGFPFKSEHWVAR